MIQFGWLELRDAIGQLIDGCDVDEKYIPAIREAVRKSYVTSDKGEQIFVVSVAQAHLFNVDTEELIWCVAQDSETEDDLPLPVLLDASKWNIALQHWSSENPVAWIAFIWRIAVPLSNRLGFVGAWHLVNDPSQKKK